MLNKILTLAALAALTALLVLSPVDGWGGAHVGYTHVGPGGVSGPRGPCPRRCQHTRPSSLRTAGRIRDTLLLTSGREESTQIIMGKRLMAFDEPWMEVAVQNPG